MYVAWYRYDYNVISKLRRLSAQFARDDVVGRFIKERMKPASAAFFAPSPMQRDDTVEATLEIAPPEIAPDELAAELKAEAESRGVTASQSIRIASRMIANLVASKKCRIEPKGPLDRAVAFNERVIWQWNITPMQSGRMTLTVTLTAP
jgi:hypothetical protein